MIKNLLISVLLVLFISLNANSQEIQNAQNFVGDNNGTSNSTGIMEKVQPVNIKSDREIQIIQEIQTLRNAGSSDFTRLLNLQRELDAITKQSVTKPGDFYPAGSRPSSELLDGTDAIGNKRILAKTGMKCIATATELTGATAGKIWVVTGFQGTGTSANPDSMRVYYSTNNGVTWVGYVNIWLGGTDKINAGDIDIEIIENPSGGDKFLWAVYGLRATGGSGKWFTGGFSINITTYAATFFAFSWPGNDPAKRNYNIRMATDNAIYTSNAWLYIACSFDSTAGANKFNAQKFVRVTNPYTTTVTLTYRGDRVGWFMSDPIINRDLNTDIAFFRNTSDSVIVSYSGVPDTTKLFFTKLDGAGSTGSSQTGFIGGTEATDIKSNARLSTNGNANGSVFCLFNQITDGKNSVKYFRTTNWGNFNTIAGQSVRWYGVNGVSQPNIMGIRNGYTHKISLVKWGPSSVDSVMYITAHNTAGNSVDCYMMNPVANFTTGAYGPAVGIRFVTADSCFALYSESGPTNLWAAYGCSGVPIGIKEGNIPVKYDLLQNYPNPFNPLTQIRYDIPNQMFVSLKVFDVLGREVGVLVNEIRQPGSYLVDFDGTNLSSGIYFYKIEAGEFTSIKKMMLIK
jgi:hypothetical protein